MRGKERGTRIALERREGGGVCAPVHYVQAVKGGRDDIEGGGEGGGGGIALERREGERGGTGREREREEGGGKGALATLMHASSRHGDSGGSGIDLSLDSACELSAPRPISSGGGGISLDGRRQLSAPRSISNGGSGIDLSLDSACELSAPRPISSGGGGLPGNAPKGTQLPGHFLLLDFITETEEAALLAFLDEGSKACDNPWRS